MPKHTAIHTATIQGKIKPASRPRYDGWDIQGAIFAAARVSVKHNCPMYVVPTAYGYAVIHDASTLNVYQSYVKVNSREVTWYQLTHLIELAEMERQEQEQ